MALNKVEICGVNTAKLPMLTQEEKDALFIKIKAGDQAKEEKPLSKETCVLCSA